MTATSSRWKTGWASTSPRAATVIGLEGTAEQVAMARDVLNDLYARIGRGEEVDTGLVDASIAMAAEPVLHGIIKADAGAAAPPIMIRTRKKTIVPRTPAQAHYMRELTSNDMIFALGPAGTGKTYVAVAQAVAHADQRQRPAADPVAPGGGGGRAAGLPSRRHEGEGRSVSAPALRRAVRLPARRAGRAADRVAARSRSRRSPSCAGARWPMRS